MIRPLEPKWHVGHDRRSATIACAPTSSSPDRAAGDHSSSCAAGAAALAAARDRGCKNLQAIALQQSIAMQLPQQLVEEYLCRNLHYRLGAKQRSGLELYYRKAAEMGLIHTIPQGTLDDCQIKHCRLA